MKNLLRFALLAPFAVAAVACGDDTEPAATGDASSSDTSAATGTPTSSSASGSPTSSSSSTPTSSSTDTSTSTSSGDGGAGGSGGSTGTVCQDEGTGGTGVGGFEAADPITAVPDTWTWVDFPDSRCMNDTPTGIGVNLSPTNDEDVVIFLQGGNACFNTITCAITAHAEDGYGQAEFDSDEDGIFDRDLFQRDPANPIGDWSWAYVPYCTGDVHAGDNQGVDVGNATRNFRGFRNMHEYLERLVATFPNAKRVMLTGVSAGGFGAAYNYDQVKRAFGDGVDVYLVDDSGPPMAQEFVPACLQARFKELWGLNKTLPQDCTNCRACDTFTEEFITYALETYSDQRFALISSNADGTIRQFWGFGNDECANVDSVPGAYAEEKYQAGLEDLRDRVATGDNFNLFMPTSDRHVWVDDAEGLATTVDGSPALIDWIGQVINDDPAWQSWPEPQ